MLRALCEIPTSRTWVPHADRDINMLALVASLSQDGIPNALCVIVTVARGHTEVRRLRLDRTGDAVLRQHCPSSCSSRRWTSPSTILLMTESSFWQSGCRPRFSFVIRQPLTDKQKLSVSFACLSFRPWLCQAAPTKNHNHSSN